MILLLVTFAGIALFDLVPLFSKKQGSAIAAFLVLFVLALVISVLLVMNVQVPSVMMFLADVLKSIGLHY